MPDKLPRPASVWSPNGYQKTALAESSGVTGGYVVALLWRGLLTTPQRVDLRSGPRGVVRRPRHNA